MTAAAAPRSQIVRPFARALSLLGAFTPNDRWIGNGDLAVRTGLPLSTVSRLAQSLVLLGYLDYAQAARKYQLAPRVLSLGYAAIAHSDIQRCARLHMQALARDYKFHVNLCTRDRLDLFVLESCVSPQCPRDLILQVGTRIDMMDSPMGWSFLAALAETERHYLLEKIQKRSPREWQRARKRASLGISQVQDMGFCTSLGDWDSDVAIAAVPLSAGGQSPLVLAFTGPGATATRARLERDLGPRLLAAAAAIQQDSLRA